jgi:hypothetical protein
MVFAAMLVAGSSPAGAIQRCHTTCDQSYADRGCVVWRTHCEDDQAAPTTSYGSIAYGRNSQAFGFSHGWENQSKAESVALQNCGKHGNDCEAIVWFERKCGAVAARGDSTAVFWGLGNTPVEARKVAMDNCTKDNGRDCEVKVSHCSK